MLSMEQGFQEMVKRWWLILDSYERNAHSDMILYLTPAEYCLGWKMDLSEWSEDLTKAL
jgi:hypothetical protein